MYVCLCNAVTDKAIRNAVRQHGPHTIKQLRSLVPIGKDCGKCMRQARQILLEERAAIIHLHKVA
ncbi:bacterioferritin-associated ferredoxin [Serratia sp. UGAL515B_01]|uniref:bacterioferritin-associated ferredoxin n=1 Tax=Serratia sp. UGAL515B_01 TaxID=2986763 RepID=UPI002953362D|nr:bacterioferritin-associated ferredoxin [Serratia sp. UGAL515B_01]WON76694.1 bacterioferritin-associated ferredoxin [Serratia sp. UGAL515B_01]